MPWPISPASYPDDLKANDLRDNFKHLQRELDRGRYLLVLDGLERALVAYHRWNAAQMRDDTVEDAESIIKDRDIRACTDPKDDDVLRGLLACQRTKVLVSSRLIPLALEDRTGNLSKGVAHIHLNGLHPDDALALTRHAGVTVRDEQQFKQFVEQFGRHSLLVKLVAGRVNKFRRARGDFDAWYAAEGRDLHVSDFDLRQQQTHILQYALDGLSADARHFLSQVAAFGDAVSYDTLAVFNPYVQPAPENRTSFSRRIRRLFNSEPEQNRDVAAPIVQFDQLLSDLEERGLLRWDATKDHYDMHPVVRGTAFEQLEGDTKTAAFERIRTHFEALPADDIDNAESVEELGNTIAIYRALVGAGKWDQAARFFHNRLVDKLKDNIAAYYTVIELLAPLFPDGTDTLPRLDDAFLKSAITGTLASMYYYIGRTDEALVLNGLALKRWLDSTDTGNLIIGLLNYAISLHSANQLALAQRAYETALALAEATDDTNQIAMSRLFLLFIYKDTGGWDAAGAAYAALQDHPPREVMWQAEGELRYAESLVYRGLDAATVLDKAEKLAIRSSYALVQRQIKGLRGEVALAHGDYDAARRWFEEALTMARQHGSAEVATYMGRLASVYAKQNNRDKATEMVDEALAQPAKEEIHNLNASIAETYSQLGMQDEASAWALEAYRQAWADGPPYVRWWYLERAKAVLDALGEPYPDMPPFDETKIGKLPYEDEINALIAAERARRQ